MDEQKQMLVDAAPAVNQVSAIILSQINEERDRLFDSFWQSCTSTKFDKQAFIDQMVRLKSGETLIVESLKKIKAKIEKG